MTACRGHKAEWREFERLIARIEAEVGPAGMIVTSPDRIRCRLTGRLREVDASIRTRVGTVEVLLTIECRQRSRTQDVTWIEQLAAKKLAIGADHTIAVSASGFSADAKLAALQHGIALRTLSEISAEEINSLLRIDFVVLWHKACAIAGVGIRAFRSQPWVVPDPNNIDFTLPQDADPFAPLFRNTETGARWSLNDLWRQLQDAADPFEGIEKSQPPVVRTACFPYPGTVTLETPEGPRILGDVLLSVALWIEAESVPLAAAKKVEYASAESSACLQRVEFTSQRSQTRDRRLSLQISKSSVDVSDLRIGGSWPAGES